MNSYRAEVHISGAVCQKLYGKNLPLLRKRAIKTLTHWEPGFGCTYPKQVILSRSVGQLSGNRNRWEVVETIPFESIPPGQRDYLNR